MLSRPFLLVRMIDTLRTLYCTASASSMLMGKRESWNHFCKYVGSGPIATHQKHRLFPGPWESTRVHRSLSPSSFSTTLKLEADDNKYSRVSDVPLWSSMWDVMFSFIYIMACWASYPRFPENDPLYAHNGGLFNSHGSQASQGQDP